MAIKVRRLSYALGAEITGVDLRKPLDKAAEAEVSEMMTSHFCGMTQDESAGLLKYLFAHSVRPEFTYRHSWRVNDLLMWDNRCTMHLAPADYTHDQPRHMHRITVLGTPSGRHVEEAVS